MDTIRLASSGVVDLSLVTSQPFLDSRVVGIGVFVDGEAFRGS